MLHNCATFLMVGLSMVKGAMKYLSLSHTGEASMAEALGCSKQIVRACSPFD